MRIIAGTAKGRRLKSVRGMRVRPTLARVRESLFDILAPRMEGCRFLDLFAGTGSVGIEALSRGASEAVFVERDRAAVQALTTNLTAIGLADRAQVLAMPVHQALERLAYRRFDVIFCDPPYEQAEAAAEVLLLLGREQGPLAPTGWVVVQHRTTAELPLTGCRLTEYDRRRFGDTVLTFWRRSSGEGSISGNI